MPTFRHSCPYCVNPAGHPSAVRTASGAVVVRFSRGAMGGELWPFLDRDTGEVHWIECVVITNDEGFPVLVVPIESFLPFIHAAAYLGVKRSTLYAWAPYLESAEKRGALLIFRTSILVNEDIPQLENKLPKREEVSADRNSRALGGQVRPGRHIAGCLNAHQGPCIDRPRPNDPRRSSKRILRELDRKPKK